MLPMENPRKRKRQLTPKRFPAQVVSSFEMENESSLLENKSPPKRVHYHHPQQEQEEEEEDGEDDDGCAQARTKMRTFDQMGNQVEALKRMKLEEERNAYSEINQLLRRLHFERRKQAGPL